MDKGALTYALGALVNLLLFGLMAWSGRESDRWSS
jgi:hypothetical protein